VLGNQEGKSKLNFTNHYFNVMKRKLIFPLLTLLLSFSIVAFDKAFDNVSSQEELVWICTEKYSKRYHASENGCKGMCTCKGDKLQVTLEQAQADGKTPCGFCY